MEVLFYIVLFIFGTIMGSFYAVLGTRLPKNESIIKPGSHCEYCQHLLKWYELIPVFSYLIQKGKCRKCGHKLSLSYPMVEIFTGILFCISYLKFGLTPSFGISLILSSLVTIIFISDIKYMIILDSPLVISSILIFLLKWYFFDFKIAGFSLLEGLLTFITMYAIGKLGNFLFKKESLGGGDIKLAFLFGLTINYKMSVVALVLSSFLALPYAIASMFLNQEHEVPFGPFLISALWLVFLFYEKFEQILFFLLTI